VRRTAGCPAVENARVVLDTVAVTQLAHHFHVKACALLDALSLDEASLRLEESDSFFELALDLLERAFHLVGGRDVVAGGKDGDRVGGHHHLAGHRIDRGYSLDLVAEERNTCDDLFVHRLDFEQITAHSKRAATQSDVVAGKLHIDEPPQYVFANVALADLEL